MEGVPASQESSAGSVSVRMEILDEPEVQAQLPLLPDWPELN
jgi:hypothetical protein